MCIRDRFWSGRLCRAGDDRVAMYPWRSSFCSLWVLSIPWHECGAVCLGIYQVRIFIPQAAAVSKRGSVPCLHGRNPCLGRKDTGRWHSPYEKAGTAGKKETDETEKEIRKEWCCLLYTSNDNSISAYLVQQGNCYVMGNRLNVHQMKCIRKIPVGEGDTDKHTNIAFISEKIWRAVMTEDISETIRIMKKFNMDDKQRRRFNRLRENYGLLPIKKR